MKKHEKSYRDTRSALRFEHSKPKTGIGNRSGDHHTTKHVQMKPVRECSLVKVLQQLKNHHRHLDRSPTSGQVGLSRLQRIPWAAA
jgi:hypothetical protein